MDLSPTEHKQRTTAVFDLVATGYDHPALRLFPFCADRLVDAIRPRPGQKILDIGTGTGAVATALAQSVLPSGRVQAIDLAENMIEQAVTNVGKRGLTNVLTKEVTVNEAIHNSSFPRLDILTSGTLPPNPTELLGSSQMADLINQLREMYDMFCWTLLLCYR